MVFAAFLVVAAGGSAFASPEDPQTEAELPAGDAVSVEFSTDGGATWIASIPEGGGWGGGPLAPGVSLNRSYKVKNPSGGRIMLAVVAEAPKVSEWGVFVHRIDLGTKAGADRAYIGASWFGHDFAADPVLKDHPEEWFGVDDFGRHVTQGDVLGWVWLDPGAVIDVVQVISIPFHGGGNRTQGQSVTLGLAFRGIAPKAGPDPGGPGCGFGSSFGSGSATGSCVGSSGLGSSSDGGLIGALS